MQQNSVMNVQKNQIKQIKIVINVINLNVHHALKDINYYKMVLVQKCMKNDAN